MDSRGYTSGPPRGVGRTHPPHGSPRVDTHHPPTHPESPSEADPGHTGVTGPCDRKQWTTGREGPSLPHSRDQDQASCPVRVDGRCSWGYGYQNPPSRPRETRGVSSTRPRQGGARRRAPRVGPAGPKPRRSAGPSTLRRAPTPRPPPAKGSPRGPARPTPAASPAPSSGVRADVATPGGRPERPVSRRTRGPGRGRERVAGAASVLAAAASGLPPPLRLGRAPDSGGPYRVPAAAARRTRPGIARPDCEGRGRGRSRSARVAPVPVPRRVPPGPRRRRRPLARDAPDAAGPIHTRPTRAPAHPGPTRAPRPAQDPPGAPGPPPRACGAPTAATCGPA